MPNVENETAQDKIKLDDQKQARMEALRIQLIEELELMKPFLKKKSHRVSSTTREWEITNSDV